MNTLDQLASYVRPYVDKLIQSCAGAGVPVRIVDIIRTPAEQSVKLSIGVSWTQNSKHLPQAPENKSEAIDLVPIVILNEHKADWDPTNVAWQKIGQIGLQIGFVWGGSWQHHPDPSHFECSPAWRPQQAMPGVIRA